MSIVTDTGLVTAANPLPVSVSNSAEAVAFSNISATPGSFLLSGGLYELAVIATWSSGSVVLNQLGPDGSTYLSVSTTFLANGGGMYYLPPGTYQLAIVTATAVYATITRISRE